MFRCTPNLLARLDVDRSRSLLSRGGERRHLHAPTQNGMRGRGERGVTLVETMVASLIMAVGVMAVVGLLITTARTASVAELQSVATDIATTELETIRSLDYDLVGIATTATGYEPYVDKLPTVTETSGNLVEAVEKVEVDDAVFLIERSVTWASLDGQAEAYKLVEVAVEFETSAGTRRIVVQTGLHEGLSDGG